MKINELLLEDVSHTDQNNGPVLAGSKEPKRSKPRVQRNQRNTMSPDYTPGKAALDDEYEEVEQFTKTDIPNIQSKLDDPRN